MKRQILRLTVKRNTAVKLETSPTKKTATASQADGGTITIKGIKHGN